MTNAGWYPDPAGSPDTYRYWDGQAWSQMTTTNPAGGGQDDAAAAPPAAPANPAVPPSSAPTAFVPGASPNQPPNQPPTAPPGVPPAFGQAPEQPYGAVPPTAGGYGGPPAYPVAPPGHWNPAPQPNKGGGSGKVIAIVVAAVVVLALIAVGTVLAIRSGDDDSSADDKPGKDKSSKTEDSDKSDGTDEPDDPDTSSGSTVKPSGIQCSGGGVSPAVDVNAATQTSAGLTITRPAGFIIEPRLTSSFPFAGQLVISYTPVNDTWISEHAVGALPKANGFDDTADAAEIVVQCLTSNEDVFGGFESRTDLESEDVTIDGLDGHKIVTEIRVDDPRVTVPGDVLTVIVVDTGSDENLGVYFGVAPIDDTARQAVAEGVVDSLTATPAP